MSTFASYLKGDEEPTDEEIQASVTAMECIKSSNIPASLFGNDKNIDGKLIKVLLKSVATEKNDDNSRYFETELLFIMELSVSLFLFCKDDVETGKILLDKLSSLCEIDGISKTTIPRLVSYKILIISVLEDCEYLGSLINDQLLLKNEIFDDKFFKSDMGTNILQRLLDLAEIPNYQTFLLQTQGFWKLLRKYTSLGEPSKQVYIFLDNCLLKSEGLINDINFMWVLGLFDEMSSIGAIGTQWEQEYNKLIQTGHKVDKENPYQEIVELSLKSINLTTHLVNKKLNVSKSEIVAIIQALSHQCLNPCYQIRKYAMTSLENMLLKIMEPFINEEMTVTALIEMGLYPLTTDLDGEKKNDKLVHDFLSLLSSTYLHYLKLEKTDNDTYLKVLSIFNKFVDDEKVESQLQDMITEKRKIEKKEETSVEPSKCT